MALITTHATLKSAVAEWLNRSDLSSSGVGIELMIQMAEKRLDRDPRVRNLEASTITVDAEEENVPSGMKQLEAIAHDGATYYGPLEIVGADELPNIKAQYGLTGPPRAVAVLDTVLRFAPVPDATYTLDIAYWKGVDTALSSGSNWIITSHPDLYLYATLVESAPYLKDDPRVATWEQQLEQRIQALDANNWDRQYSGTLRRQFRPIGG